MCVYMLRGTNVMSQNVLFIYDIAWLKDGLVYLSELCLSSPGWRSYTARNKMISGAAGQVAQAQKYYRNLERTT